MAYAYSAALWIAAQGAALTLIKGGASDPTIKIRDSGDVLLATAVIDETGSTCSGTTGDITFAIATQEASADASGTAAYAQICDGDGTVHAEMDCAQGTSPVAGACVMNTLTIVSGAPVDILSATIPAGFTIA